MAFKTAFIVMSATPMLQSATERRALMSPHESVEDIMVKLANMTCSGSSCVLLATKQDIQENGANKYISFHRRRMERDGEGPWRVSAGHSWDMSAAEAVQALAESSPR